MSDAEKEELRHEAEIGGDLNVQAWRAYYISKGMKQVMSLLRFMERMGVEYEFKYAIPKNAMKDAPYDFAQFSSRLFDDYAEELQTRFGIPVQFHQEFCTRYIEMVNAERLLGSVEGIEYVYKMKKIFKTDKEVRKEHAELVNTLKEVFQSNYSKNAAC